MSEFNSISAVIGKIGIIVPAYNVPDDQLAELLRRIGESCRKLTCTVLVVDDGSARPAGLPRKTTLPLTLIRHPENLGKGQALKTGFSHFLRSEPVDLILTVDADLQHPPEKIPEFIRAYREGRGRIITGYRRRRPGIMPFHRMISNSLTSLVISLLTGQLVRDSQCGFRLIEAAVLKNLQLQENRFHLESELLLRAGAQRIRIGSVPIPTVYTNQKSSIKNVRDTLNFVGLIGRFITGRRGG